MQSQQSGTVPQKQIDVGSHYVNNKYTLIHKMHEGMNSKIFVGAFMKNNRQVTRAIKIQYNSRQATSNGVFGQGTTKNDKNGGIRHQIHVLRTLFTNQYGKVQIKTGFPHTFEFGQQKNSNYIVMGMYGPNLGQLMKLCGGKFSARTTLLLSLQIMDRLQDLHNKKYLYGNMNPQNFLIGINKQSYLLFMIDFSKATIYKSKTKNVHIPYQQTNNYQNPSYDTTFMSLNSHLGVQASRRDDIQSFMYLILYLFKGRLPWIVDNSYGTNGGHAEDQQQIFNLDIKRDQTINSLNLISGGFTSLQEQRSKVLEIKRRLSPESLFKNFSFELIDLMYYIRTLSFYEKPDYQYIRKKLWNALYQTDYQQLRNNIIIYDWNQREPLDYQIYRDEPKFKLKSDKEKQKDDVMDNDNASDKGSDQCLKSKETGSKNSSRDLISSSGGKKGKKDKKRTSLASENKNISSNQELKSSLFKQDKKKQDKILQQDDANVVEDEDDFNDEVDQQTLSKIDEKLKLVRKLDESKMSQSLYKDGAQKKGNSNAVQSRFKQCSSQKGLK